MIPLEISQVITIYGLHVMKLRSLINGAIINYMIEEPSSKNIKEMLTFLHSSSEHIIKISDDGVEGVSYTQRVMASEMDILFYSYYAGSLKKHLDETLIVLNKYCDVYKYSKQYIPSIDEINDFRDQIDSQLDLMEVELEKYRNKYNSK